MKKRNLKIYNFHSHYVLAFLFAGFGFMSINQLVATPFASGTWLVTGLFVSASWFFITPAVTFYPDGFKTRISMRRITWNDIRYVTIDEYLRSHFWLVFYRSPSPQAGKVLFMLRYDHYPFGAAMDYLQAKIPKRKFSRKAWRVVQEKISPAQAYLGKGYMLNVYGWVFLTLWMIAFLVLFFLYPGLFAIFNLGNTQQAFLWFLLMIVPLFLEAGFTGWWAKNHLKKEGLDHQ